MDPTPAPLAENRDAIVRQDLASGVHPILPHKLLEKQQLVIGSAKDSIVDANGKEYLDAMAGLWCVEVLDRAIARLGGQLASSV